MRNVIFSVLFLLSALFRPNLSAVEVWLEAVSPTVTEPTSVTYIQPLIFQIKADGALVYDRAFVTLSGTATRRTTGNTGYDYLPLADGGYQWTVPFPVTVSLANGLHGDIYLLVYKDLLAEGSEGVTATLQPDTHYTIRAGQGSASVRILDPGYVNVAPTIVTQASASPASVTSGNSTTLTVLGADTTPESELTYTWGASGPGPVTFGATNGTNSGKSTTASFSVTGSYDFWAVVRDPDGGQRTSTSVTVQVTLPPTAPTIVTAATATPDTASGKIITLKVLAADSMGEANLTYTWSTVGTPPSTPTYGVNGTNAAKNVSAIISKTGTYQFLCTIRNPSAMTVTSTVYATVSQILTTFKVTTGTPTTNGLQMPFLATLADQFGLPMSPTPTVSWSVSSGGTINAAGLFQASAGTGGPYSVRAWALGRPSYASAYKTGTRIIAITGPEFGAASQSVPQTVAISGPAGSTTFNIINGSLAAGGNSFTQVSPSTSTYSILSNAGASEVHFNVGGVAVNPPLPIPSISISPLVRGSTWPSSVAPGATSVSTVTFNPPLAASMRFMISYVGSGGQAVITGNDTLSTTGGQLTVMGITQSEPGTSLRIQGLDGAGNIIAFGPAFTVCAHMVDWTILSSKRISGAFPMHPNEYGLLLLDGFSSDGPGGSHSYLDKCDALEKVEIVTMDPAFIFLNLSVQDEPFSGKSEAVKDIVTENTGLINYGQSGWEFRAQLITCACYRCGGAGDFDAKAIQKSGMQPAFYTFPYAGVQYLTTQVVKAAETVDVYSADAALGNDVFDTQPLPPK